MRFGLFTAFMFAALVPQPNSASKIILTQDKFEMLYMNEKYAVNEGVYLRQVNESHVAMNIKFKVIKALNNLTLLITYSQKFKKQPNPRIINLKIRTCDLFNDPMKSQPIVGFFYKAMFAPFDFPNKCPVEMKTYHVHRYFVSSSMVPPFFPPGLFKVDVSTKEGNEDIFRFLWDFSLKYIK